MHRQTVFVFGILLMVTLASVMANPLPREGSAIEERHRRDIQGLFDVVAGFMTKDASGKTKAGEMVNGFLSGLGNLGKAAMQGKR